MAIPTPAPDRTCIVTGASSGIGEQLARQLAARGHGVTLVARREDRLRTLAEDLQAAHGIRAEVVAADLSDADARTALVAAVTERGLVPDVLVNNAGFSTVGPVAEVDPDREIGMIRTNVEAVAHLCALVVGGMVERGRGAVLNVASTAAFQPLPGQAGYAASKAFVRSYSQALAAEVKPHGVTVTALCPGPVKTEFADAAGFEDGGEGALPDFMWVGADEVATCALEGLDAGRSIVIPGASNRVLAGLAHLTPRAVLLPLLARQHPAL
jgi:short-subunit dehydrogenase